MAFIPAKCTQCGASIEVDDSLDAGICKFCGTAFVTEKVINNYNIQSATINVAGVDINNLLLRATQFENANDVDKAIEYYNRILDIDANRSEAIQGIKRLTKFYIGATSVSRQDILKIENYLSNNEKIQAIKFVRELTGMGLAEAKEFIDNYNPSTDLSEPQNIPVSSSSSNGGCYIATAVYGSYDCPQVWTLRRYRDYSLAKTRWGRIFIKLYYATSPTLVKLFGNTVWFKNVNKIYLDYMVKNLNQKGFRDTPYNDINW